MGTYCKLHIISYREEQILHFLKEGGFSSNISQCVNLNVRKLLGFKIHDFHIILQHLLPLALRGMLCKSVVEPLIELLIFLRYMEQNV